MDATSSQPEIPASACSSHRALKMVHLRRTPCVGVLLEFSCSFSKVCSFSTRVHLYEETHLDKQLWRLINRPDTPPPSSSPLLWRATIPLPCSSSSGLLCICRLALLLEVNKLIGWQIDVWAKFILFVGMSLFFRPHVFLLAIYNVSIQKRFFKKMKT